MGPRIHQAEHRRQRRLQGDAAGPPAPKSILERNDDWIGGPLPKVKRIIWRMVPSAGNRRALLERGDADISYDLPNKDFVELQGRRQAQHRLDAVLERHPVHRHERDEAAVRQSQGAPGGRLRRFPTRRSWTRCCSASPSRCSARPPTRRPRSPGRSRTSYNTDIAKAKAAAGRSRLSERLRDDAVVRPRLCRRQRAALRADAGEPRRRSASRRRSTRSPAPTGAPS